MTEFETPQLAVGIDVGATKIAAALVDRRGDVVEERLTATCASEGQQTVIGRIAAVARDLLHTAPKPVAGIGIGTPGYVDPVSGIVTNAVNLGWTRVDLVNELSASLSEQMPEGAGIWIENDANVMALGDYHYGAAEGCGNFVYVSIGSGLGSGIILDHKLVGGAEYHAAELGHLSLDPNGRLCACGMRGCVETVVSGPGILATAKELLTTGDPSSLNERRRLTPKDVVEAASQGDPLSLRVFDVTAQWLGQALAPCIALLNPARIVIGGGMGLAAFDLLHNGVFHELERRILRDSYAHMPIVPSQVHSSAVGASALVWHAVQNSHAA
ncbi:MAG: ROK family protein [Caldilineaceae bacterium]